MADFSQDLYAVAGKASRSIFRHYFNTGLCMPDFCLIPMGTEASVSLQSDGVASSPDVTDHGY
jgi:hypothetical protein